MSIDVLDDRGLRTGEILPRTEIHRLGKLHRVVHLYLFDTFGRLLLQKRSATVDHYPRTFSISVLGHIDAGESSSRTVLRELSEELGLTRKHTDIEFIFSYRSDAQLSETYIDRQFNDIYICQSDFQLEEIKFNTDEVTSVILVNFKEFRGMATSGSSILAPVYQDECRDLVYYLGHRFENLD